MQQKETLSPLSKQSTAGQTHTDAQTHTYKRQRKFHNGTIHTKTAKKRDWRKSGKKQQVSEGEWTTCSTRTDVYRCPEADTCSPHTCHEVSEAHRVQLHVGCVNKSGVGGFEWLKVMIIASHFYLPLFLSCTPTRTRARVRTICPLFCFASSRQRIKHIIVRTEILLTFTRRSEKVEIVCAFGRRIRIAGQFRRILTRSSAESQRQLKES